jgi:Protein of unknown function (DUF2971)
LTYELWADEIVSKLGWQNRLTRWEERLRENPADLLWHYTSLETLQKIIGCPKTIHASLLGKMNDYQEGRWLLSRVREDPSVFRDIVSSGIANGSQLHRGMLAGHSPLLHTFVFSLSSQSDLLSQWRAYANGGRGVAIGFDVSEMTETVKCWRHWDKLENKIVLAPVEYEEENQKIVIDVLVQKLMERQEVYDRHIRDIDPRATGLSRQRPLLETRSWLMEILRFFEPHFKNPAFKEEREWRLIYYASQSPEAAPLVPSYRVSKYDDDLIPYVEFRLATCIRSVILGPLCKADVKTVQDMLNASKLRFPYTSGAIWKS